MNMFGGSQSGDTKKIILNLEESFKPHTSKLEKFERLLSENINNIKIHEEKLKALQLVCADNIEKNLQAKTNSLEPFKKIIPSIIS